MTRKTFSGIYCIENMINGHKYIGQSLDLKKRIEHHIRGLKKGYDDCIVLQNAWNKYGEENFKVYILIYCEKNQLDELEIFFIKNKHSHVSEGGYNIALGGNSVMEGRNHSDETKRKISEKHKGWTPSEKWIETRRKYMLSDKNPTKGRKRTEIEKENMRKSRLGKPRKPHTLESKEKISKANKGKKRTDEVIEKMRQRRGKNHWAFGRKMNQEEKNNMSNFLIGRKHGKNTTSKYSGVSYISKLHKWKASFSYKGKDIYLGVFETEIEAAMAYNEGVLEYLGWKARINLITEEDVLFLWENSDE